MAWIEAAQFLASIYAEAGIAYQRLEQEWTRAWAEISRGIAPIASVSVEALEAAHREHGPVAVPDDPTDSGLPETPSIDAQMAERWKIAPRLVRGLRTPVAPIGGEEDLDVLIKLLIAHKPQAWSTPAEAAAWIYRLAGQASPQQATPESSTEEPPIPAPAVGITSATKEEDEVADRSA